MAHFPDTYAKFLLGGGGIAPLPPGVSSSLVSTMSSMKAATRLAAAPTPLAGTPLDQLVPAVRSIVHAAVNRHEQQEHSAKYGDRGDCLPNSQFHDVRHWFVPFAGCTAP